MADGLENKKLGKITIQSRVGTEGKKRKINFNKARQEEDFMDNKDNFIDIGDFVYVESSTFLDWFEWEKFNTILLSLLALFTVLSEIYRRKSKKSDSVRDNK